jgi:hypothetical protein
MAEGPLSMEDCSASGNPSIHDISPGKPSPAIGKLTVATTAKAPPFGMDTVPPTAADKASVGRSDGGSSGT